MSNRSSDAEEAVRVVDSIARKYVGAKYNLVIVLVLIVLRAKERRRVCLISNICCPIKRVEISDDLRDFAIS
tara:strand:- start:2669 stop:2884 length:216 start_codon:yes stop_codon:yes gene_type:complete